MAFAGMPPNTTVVNREENAFVLLNVPPGTELKLPAGWVVTEDAPLDLVRYKRCTQLNISEAKTKLPAAAEYVV